MKPNNNISFKVSTDLLTLIDKSLAKLNSETKIKISRSDFIRVVITRLCNELLHGSITSTELLYIKPK